MDGMQRILQAVTVAISIMGAVIVIWGIADSVHAFFVMKITRSLLIKDVIQESEASGNGWGRTCCWGSKSLLPPVSSVQ